MTYKSILVHIDGTPAAERRIGVAAKLAAAHGARLEGVAIVQPLELPQRLRSHPGAKAIMTEEYEKSRAAAQKMAQAFAAQARGAGAATASGRVVEAEPVEGLQAAARAADLVVLGQPGADDLGAFGGHFVEESVTEVACPVLVVPAAGLGASVGERIVVAWKSANASARAMADARPLLEKAKQVWVLVVDEGGGEANAQEALDYLERHGVRATSVVAKGDDAGAAICAQAQQLGADLVVMGAFARHRIREMILGGATASVLRNARTCVFMSH